MKLRYTRVIGLIVIIVVMVFVGLYLYVNRSVIYEYQGDIQSYVCSYRQDDLVYTFDLKAFEEDDMYVSMNDMYNMMVILDPQTRVYTNYQKHTMVYVLSDETYYFDFGHDEISYDDQCIDVTHDQSHIYVCDKNIYMNVNFVEKLLFKEQLKIKFKNKNAIIE